MSALTFSEVLGRRIRSGDWVDQKVSTFREVGRAIDEGRWTDASELANYFVDEARVCWDLYRQWTRELEDFMLSRGVSDEDVRTIRTEIAEVTRMPDGQLFEPEKEWSTLHTLIADVTEAADRQDAGRAHELMGEAKETWRRTHDRDVDTIYGYSSEISTRLGEDAILEMWQVILQPWFDARYKRFDIDTFEWGESLDVLMYVTFEAMRGHLVGPERTGDIGLEEFDDRYVVSFDPCGSGGRTVQGDEIEHTGPRMEAPYNWKVSEEPHDWNHYTPGVCLYCAHCIVLTEQMPMDNFGYPVRVVDPPVYTPGQTERQQCRWTMYKDPTAVPEEMYTRAGRTKPTEFGSRAHRDRKVFLGPLSAPDPE
ncbi:MAG: hypothetical protein RJQ01_01435 [Microcella sp.]|uniref:hypothetical protein n=1 Tax=Microcella sp. TaxID=1913979 RepID=UPI0033147479